VRTGADSRGLVDLQRVGLEDLEPFSELLAKLLERGNAAPVALHRGDRGSGFEQRPSEPTRTRSDLVNPLALKIARYRRDPRQQLPVENEVLTERLGRAEAVTGNDRAERFGSVRQGASARNAALWPAIRIAAAIGRGSARSCPAMSNAVP